MLAFTGCFLNPKATRNTAVTALLSGPIMNSRDGRAFWSGEGSSCGVARRASAAPNRRQRVPLGRASGERRRVSRLRRHSFMGT